MPTPAFWRQWHRWIGAPAALFLLFVSITGVLVAGTEFLSADEALREANRKLVSAVHTNTPIGDWTGTIATAMTAAATQAPGAPVDRVTIELKGQSPTISVYLGKPAGGEDRRLLFDATTGAFLRTIDYVDKPLIHRIHSGEFFGDGGLVASMMWGLALMALTVTGLLMYWRLMNVKRAERVGFRRFFF